jgi:hypothetical protein
MAESGKMYLSHTTKLILKDICHVISTTFRACYLLTVNLNCRYSLSYEYRHHPSSLCAHNSLAAIIYSSLCLSQYMRGPLLLCTLTLNP